MFTYPNSHLQAMRADRKQVSLSPLDVLTNAAADHAGLKAAPDDVDACEETQPGLVRPSRPSVRPAKR
jgi:hypothetical protein